MTPVPVSTTAAAAPPSTAAPALAADVKTTTCPENNGVGILQGSWDTRATGISNSIDSYIKDDGWEGVLWAPHLKLTQNCWDITGTYQDNSGNGPVSGVIKKDPLTGSFVMTGTWANNADTSSSARSAGEFSLTMAADNQSFKGYLLTMPPDQRDTTGYPENWAGKKQ